MVRQANFDEHCAGIVTWCHTFSPSKMWINGLAALQKQGTPSMSELYDALIPLEVEGLLYLMARHGQEHNIGQDVSLFLTRLRDEKADITGEDLAELGAAPGPDFGKTLRRVLHAKLDGHVKTRKEQLSLAAHLLALARRNGQGNGQGSAQGNPVDSESENPSPS